LLIKRFGIIALKVLSLCLRFLSFGQIFFQFTLW